MPFFYDLDRQTTTNAAANTETTHMRGVTVANQETVGLYGCYAAARLTVAGGAQLNIKHCTSVPATSGVAQTPQAKNLRSVAAQSTWFNDISVITAGTTLTYRVSFGFAQTGGTGGYQPISPQAAIQMQPNAVNPLDMEFTSNAASTAVPFALTIDMGEGI